jgi:ureidoglycolate lyase
MHTENLTLEPLTQARFKSFGDVIESTGKQGFSLNDGMAERFHDLATIDVDKARGRPIVSLLNSRPQQFPFVVKFLQRAPLSSQAFIPLTAHPFITVVASTDEQGLPDEVLAFISDGQQGINYRPGVWHHTVLVPYHAARFLVLDRGGPGKNFEEFWFAEPDRLLLDLR